MDNWTESMWNWALSFWSSGLAQIQNLLTISPENLGATWGAVKIIYSAIQGSAYALVIVFFYLGLVRTGISFRDMKRPEVAVSLFLRFILVKAFVDWGLDLLLFIMSLGQGFIRKVFTAGNLQVNAVALPAEIVEALRSANFWQQILLWLVSLLGIAAIIVQCILIVLLVYGRFLRIYVTAAIGAIPLSTIAGEGTQSIGFRYLKNFASICMEGIVIGIACVLYSYIVSEVPPIELGNDSPMVMLLSYIVGICFQTFLLTGLIKGADTLLSKFMS